MQSGSRARRFLGSGELLQPSRKGELGRVVREHVGNRSDARDLLQRIQWLPLSPPIRGLDVERVPHPGRQWEGQGWDWRLIAFRAHIVNTVARQAPLILTLSSRRAHGASGIPGPARHRVDRVGCPTASDPKVGPTAYAAKASFPGTSPSRAEGAGGSALSSRPTNTATDLGGEYGGTEAAGVRVSKRKTTAARSTSRLGELPRGPALPVVPRRGACAPGLNSKLSGSKSPGSLDRGGGSGAPRPSYCLVSEQEGQSRECGSGLWVGAILVCTLVRRLAP